ncbi:hypothetical protein C656_08570 [Enterococcus hirae 57-03-H11]|nr:hypothetical protein C656_08570 [Enterococcus hirae 57-03-H11]
MKTKRQTSTFLHIGTLFALLTLFLFLCYSYFRSSDIPCNAFGWLLLDHPGLSQVDESLFLLILSSLCGFIFSLAFRTYVKKQLPKKMDEAATIFVASRLLALLTVLSIPLTKFIVLFILNGLVIILSIFTYFIFSLIFKKLRLPLLMQLIPLFCFVYSVFSFLVLALAPTFDPANIQITSNFLELLFISCLGMMMWQIRKTVQDK